MVMEQQRSEIAHLRAQIAQRDRCIAEHEHSIAQREARIGDYEQRLVLLAQHVARIRELEDQVHLLVEQLEEAGCDKAALEARLKELLARRRRLDQDALGQLVLAFCGEPALAPAPCANEAPDGETPQDVLRPRHVRKHAPRKLSYEALPREHVQHELPAGERTCQITGKELVIVGEKTSEQLEYCPAKLVVIVHHRAVYGLGAEDRAERKIEPVVAPAPVQPIENANAGPSLLAWILV